MIIVFVFASFLTATISFLMGLFVFIKNRKSKINKLWLFTSSAIMVWSLGLGMELTSSNYSNALFWNKVLNVGAIFIPISFYHFVVTFLEKERQGKGLIPVGYIISSSLIFVLIKFPELLVKGVPPSAGFKYWIEIGPLYYFFVVFFVFYMSRLMFLLARARKETTGAKKAQISYLLAATIIGFGAGVTNFFPQLLGLYPYGNYLMPLYMIFITYAMLKHHLFNISVVITELLVFLLWVFILARILISETSSERLMNAILFIAVLLIGVLLIRSVLKEVRMREQMEMLAKKLEVANVRLKQLDEAKSDFISIASHQLRAPLTAVKGYSSMLLEGSFGELPDKAKSAIEKIFESSRRLVLTIGDFLDITKIEAGRMQYDFTEVDLKEMVSLIVEEYRMTLKKRNESSNGKEKKNIEIKFDYNLKSDYKIIADMNKIHQVISNLMDNAIKYTEAGSIKVGLVKNDFEKNVVVKVKDTGIGLSPESRVRLFQKFSRAEGVYKLHTEGSGLGLYVCKEIVRAHGGAIWAESKGEGEGSEFFVRLPLRPPSYEAPATETAKKVEEFIRKI